MGTTSKPPDGVESSPNRDRSGDGEPAIAVENLSKEYGSGDEAVRAVDGVDFEVEPGTAVGLLGPNGAGKTTTIKSLLSLIVPTSGQVRVDDIDVHDEPGVAYRRMGATLEGARNIYWRLTVKENMQFFSALAGNDPREMGDRHDELVTQFGLEGKADTVVRELSRGQKQKVSLACTMARDADVVFFDEPTLGLDVESSLDLRSELRNLVEDEGTTVLLSSHDMDVIEDVCDRVIIMNEGHIVADDTVENLLSLFNTQVYEVSVTERLDASIRDRLESTFDADNFERLPNATRFEVSVTTDEFYELVDELRSADLSVESFDAVEPDLEEVFLKITDDEDANERDRKATERKTETVSRATNP
ncbi:ABC transporter ATP-binding protein [Halorussus litoreus]|uniref:ABC transporter ATP-binding protein n=1 Tax=Halorussus litoreus TaxID=1710536 RepID=UPI000E229602|nr:ABC transporter ATP-binding protein [Halorussus litoreus]